MKGIVCVCLFAMAAAALARPDGDHYTDKYDNINVDEILENSRLRDPYLSCVLDVGKCAPEAKELKSHIKEALETHCLKCTDIQKKQTKKVIKYLINNREEDWKKLCDKYDPDRKYSKKYEDELKTVKA
uniref:Putative chemosensory protein 7 n=1 Tax=Ectropis obliqua TaxID=248899 RepID=A0A1W5LAR4_ECTOB|nr:putative chemosensory protein 7 [Ectropis obliqua]